MYDKDGGGGGDGRRPPRRRRGTKLALELDRRLASHEDLGDIIEWWDDTWHGTTRLHIEFSAGSEETVEDLEPRKFSDNEFMCFMISMLSGCSIDDRDTALHWLWPMLGLDAAKTTDPAYAREAMLKHWTG
jgi:hypothetical protein